MVEIVPAVLDKTPEEFKAHIDQIKNSESFQEGWIHIDFADGEFVPNTLVGVDVVAQNNIPLHKEAHLMVAHPLEWIDDLRKAGFERVIFHYESKDDIAECIKKIKQAGMEVGIALNPDTPIEKLEPFSHEINLVLMMAITPGFQGQPFNPIALDKIRELKEKNWSVTIAVDGSVRDTTIGDLVDAGAEQLSVGSFLLKGNIDENLEKLWEALK